MEELFYPVIITYTEGEAEEIVNDALKVIHIISGLDKFIFKIPMNKLDDAVLLERIYLNISDIIGEKVQFLNKEYTIPGVGGGEFPVLHFLSIVSNLGEYNDSKSRENDMIKYISKRYEIAEHLRLFLINNNLNEFMKASENDVENFYVKNFYIMPWVGKGRRLSGESKEMYLEQIKNFIISLILPDRELLRIIKNFSGRNLTVGLELQVSPIYYVYEYYKLDNLQKILKKGISEDKEKVGISYKDIEQKLDGIISKVNFGLSNPPDYEKFNCFESKSLLKKISNFNYALDKYLENQYRVLASEFSPFEGVDYFSPKELLDDLARNKNLNGLQFGKFRHFLKNLLEELRRLEREYTSRIKSWESFFWSSNKKSFKTGFPYKKSIFLILPLWITQIILWILGVTRGTLNYMNFSALIIYTIIVLYYLCKERKRGISQRLESMKHRVYESLMRNVGNAKDGVKLKFVKDFMKFLTPLSDKVDESLSYLKGKIEQVELRKEEIRKHLADLGIKDIYKELGMETILNYDICNKYVSYIDVTEPGRFIQSMSKCIEENLRSKIKEWLNKIGSITVASPLPSGELQAFFYDEAQKYRIGGNIEIPVENHVLIKGKIKVYFIEEN